MSDTGANEPNTERDIAVYNQLASLPLPQLVFNSVTNNVSATEITSIISFGQRPLAMLIMSPVMAKTYAQLLLQMVTQYETDTGQPVQTIQEINSRIGTRRQSDV